jgi:hypothetical protein
MASHADRENLQRAPDDLCDWADRRGMEFNSPKCKVMHMGHHNPEQSFSMKGRALDTTSEEKNIRVTATANLRPSVQCARAGKMAQNVLGQLTRAFHYRDRDVQAIRGTTLGIFHNSLFAQDRTGQVPEKSCQRGVRATGYHI